MFRLLFNVFTGVLSLIAGIWLVMFLCGHATAMWNAIHLREAGQTVLAQAHTWTTPQGLPDVSVGQLTQEATALPARAENTANAVVDRARALSASDDWHLMDRIHAFANDAPVHETAPAPVADAKVAPSVGPQAQARATSSRAWATTTGP
jgi:hypothetical protein